MGIRELMPFIAGLFVLCGIEICNAQIEDPEPDVKIHTLMERYAPEYVLPVEERRRLKWERRKTISIRRAVIDTLDISRRKKRKLLHELYNSPFTEEFREVLGSLNPEEGEDQRPD